jgi:hypothetical protein
MFEMLRDNFLRLKPRCQTVVIDGVGTLCVRAMTGAEYDEFRSRPEAEQNAYALYLTVHDTEGNRVFRPEDVATVIPSLPVETTGLLLKTAIKLIKGDESPKVD